MRNESWNRMVRIRITSADIPAALHFLTDQDFILQDIQSESDLSILLTVWQKDYKKIKAILEKRGDRCETKYRFESYRFLLKMKHRWLFLACCLFILFLSLYIPSRIYFFDVKGNHNISARWILEKAEFSGLRFGCKRAEVKSEQIKNSILNQIPELDWVGITTAGCVATIEVREKPSEETKQNPTLYVGHIVADCDGVVESVTATKGTPLCKPGQAVEKGHILISGYEDCGFVIKATKAEGEIYARTIYGINLFSPLKELQRGEKYTDDRKYSLQIGKNIINFSKDSGISPPGCVKMYSRKFLTLPGGFQLPVAIVCQELHDYETFENAYAEIDTQWINQMAEQYVLQEMTAGEILIKNSSVQELEDYYVLKGVYACREQIGIPKIEEIVNNDGKHS